MIIFDILNYYSDVYIRFYDFMVNFYDQKVSAVKIFMISQTNILFLMENYSKYDQRNQNKNACMSYIKNIIYYYRLFIISKDKFVFLSYK